MGVVIASGPACTELRRPSRTERAKHWACRECGADRWPAGLGCLRFLHRSHAHGAAKKRPPDPKMGGLVVLAQKCFGKPACLRTPFAV